MAPKNRFGQKQNKSSKGGVRGAAHREPLPPLQRKPQIEYGKPFILLEDRDKNTFQYARGTWVPYDMTIAQCRLDGQVKELPQKVKDMTRYEVRLPVA